MFVVSLVARFPAAVTYHALADRLGDDVALSAIEGTVFSGKARAVVGNQYVFDSVAWSWRPVAALTGRLEYGTRLDTPAGEVACRFGVGLGGDLVVSEVQGQLSLVALLSSIDAKTGGFNGWLHPEIQRLRFRDSELTAVTGSIRLSNFVWQNGDSVQLGDFVFDFDNDNEEYPWVFEFRDDGGPVRLAGDLTLEAGGDYQLNIAMAPREAKPELDNFFAMVGPGDSEGQRYLSYSGNLDDF